MLKIVERKLLSSFVQRQATHKSDEGGMTMCYHSKPTLNSYSCKSKGEKPQIAGYADKLFDKLSMGNENSTGIEDTADGLLINTVIIKQIIMLSYEDFQQKIKEINEISKAFSSSGTHLIFVIKKGSDSTLLWKNTVRIGCMRVEQETRKIKSHRFLKLRQFLRLYSLLANYVSATVVNEEPSCSSNNGNEAANDQTNTESPETKYTSPKTRKDITASFIFQNLDSMGEEGDEECIICLERRTEVSLACAHSFCLPCIEQWNVTSNTCPVCREEVTTGDSWVISEAPDLEEVEAEVRKALATVVK